VAGPLTGPELLKAFTKHLLRGHRPDLLPLWVPVLLFFAPRVLWWSGEEDMHAAFAPLAQECLVSQDMFRSPPGSADCDVVPMGAHASQYERVAMDVAGSDDALNAAKDALVTGVLRAINAEPTQDAAGAAQSELPTEPAVPQLEEDMFVYFEWEPVVATYVRDIIRAAMGGAAAAGAELAGPIPFSIFYEYERDLVRRGDTNEAQQVHRRMLFDAINMALNTLYPALCGAGERIASEPWLENPKALVRRLKAPERDWRAVAEHVVAWVARFDRLDRVPAFDTGADARWRTGDVLIDRMKIVQCMDERAAAEDDVVERSEAELCFLVADCALDLLLEDVAGQLGGLV
jgi:hypothetical protein